MRNDWSSSNRQSPPRKAFVSIVSRQSLGDLRMGSQALVVEVGGPFLFVVVGIAMLDAL